MGVDDLTGLPGSEIVIPGLADLGAGRDSVEASAVAMASRRLRAAGLDVPDGGGDEPAAHRLYLGIAAAGGGDPHSRYNAVVRRIVSFSRALEHARSR